MIDTAEHRAPVASGPLIICSRYDSDLARVTDSWKQLSLLDPMFWPTWELAEAVCDSQAARDAWERSQLRRARRRATVRRWTRRTHRPDPWLSPADEAERKRRQRLWRASNAHPGRVATGCFTVFAGFGILSVLALAVVGAVHILSGPWPR